MAIVTSSGLIDNRERFFKVVVVRALNFGTDPSTVQVNAYSVVDPSARLSPTQLFAQQLFTAEPQTVLTFDPIVANFDFFYLVFTISGPGQTTTQTSFDNS
jgi:hypothetical protein